MCITNHGGYWHCRFWQNVQYNNSFSDPICFAVSLLNGRSLPRSAQPFRYNTFVHTADCPPAFANGASESLIAGPMYWIAFYAVFMHALARSRILRSEACRASLALRYPVVAYTLHG
jgi:hypothetical protein